VRPTKAAQDYKGHAMAKNSVKATILSTLASSSVLTTYQSLNPDGFIAPVFFLRVINDSTEPIFVSYDGVNNHDYVRAGSDLEVSTQSNSQPNARYALFDKYEQVYVKGAAGTGTIAMTGYYV
jgi:hypothetical protein